MAARGRPRTFDRAQALRTAMELFWRHGYEGTSVSMLTDAIGITPTSLYAAFGSKEALFDEAVELYDAPGTTPTDQALAEPKVTQAIEAVLRRNADAYTDPSTPLGCMIVLSGVNLGAGHDHIGEKLAARRRSDLDRIQARIDRGIADDELPAGLDSAACARYVLTVLHGLSIAARDGSSRSDAHAVIDIAMRGWDDTVANAGRSTADL